MKRELRYLFDLYVEYMKLAVSGILLSAIFLCFYSVMAASPIVRKLLVALIVLGIFGFGVLVLRWRSAEKKELERKHIREEHEREREAQAKRNERRIEEARNYLRFTKMDAIRDDARITEELLVNDLVVLIDHLQAENISKIVVEEAINRFLIAINEDKKSTFLAVRQQILKSIIDDAILNNIIANQEKPEESRKFVS